MITYTAESLKACRLTDIAFLLNNLQTDRDALLFAIREVHQLFTRLRACGSDAEVVEVLNHHKSVQWLVDLALSGEHRTAGDQATPN